MKHRARSIMVTVAALTCLLGGFATAQDKAADTVDVLREKVRADKKVLVAVALDLTESEAKGFWPVYAAYQSDMITQYDRMAKLLGDYAAVYKTMTDEAASRLLSDFLALETDHAALLNQYRPRFQGVLPPRKVARFYQLENKLRALLNADLAENIPFVK
jgi:hypothetical protein